MEMNLSSSSTLNSNFASLAHHDKAKTLQVVSPSSNLKEGQFLPVCLSLSTREISSYEDGHSHDLDLDLDIELKKEECSKDVENLEMGCLPHSPLPRISYESSNRKSDDKTESPLKTEILSSSAYVHTPYHVKTVPENLSCSQDFLSLVESNKHCSDSASNEMRHHEVLFLTSQEKSVAHLEEVQDSGPVKSPTPSLCSQDKDDLQLPQGLVSFPPPLVGKISELDERPIESSNLTGVKCMSPSKEGSPFQNTRDVKPSLVTLPTLSKGNSSGITVALEKLTSQQNDLSFAQPPGKLVLSDSVQLLSSTLFHVEKTLEKREDQPLVIRHSSLPPESLTLLSLEKESLSHAQISPEVMFKEQNLMVALPVEKIEKGSSYQTEKKLDTMPSFSPETFNSHVPDKKTTGALHTFQVPEIYPHQSTLNMGLEQEELLLSPNILQDSNTATCISSNLDHIVPEQEASPLLQEGRSCCNPNHLSFKASQDKKYHNVIMHKLSNENGVTEYDRFSLANVKGEQLGDVCQKNKDCATSPVSLMMMEDCPDLEALTSLKFEQNAAHKNNSLDVEYSQIISLTSDGEKENQEHTVPNDSNTLCGNPCLSEVSLYSDLHDHLSENTTEEGSKHVFQWSSAYSLISSSSFKGSTLGESVLSPIQCITRSQRPLRIGLSRRQKVKHLHKKQ